MGEQVANRGFQLIWGAWLTYPPSQLEAVDAGNVQIGDPYVGFRVDSALERLQPVMGLLDGEARGREPVRVQSPPVTIVFHEQNDTGS
jgi:hypothetical protein